MSYDVADGVTNAGLVRGPHVFCEQPPGRNVADTEPVLAQVQPVPKLKPVCGFSGPWSECSSRPICRPSLSTYLRRSRRKIGRFSRSVIVR
jgi:hypothetical protein